MTCDINIPCGTPLAPDVARVAAPCSHAFKVVYGRVLVQPAVRHDDLLQALVHVLGHVAGVTVEKNE